jgi:hypothetical protein
VLTVVPRGAFKNGFDVVDDSGRNVGGFAGSAWRERGEIQIGDELWEYRRERSKRFALAGPQGTYATAEQASMWSSRWNIAVGDRLYELTKRSWLSSDYEVSVGDQVVGTIDKKGVFSSKALVNLPTEMPPPVQVFVIAVVMTQWRRDGAAAAGAASAGGAAAAS